MTAATSTPTSVAAARHNPWSVAAVALLPLMILGLLLAALWNPQDRLDQVPAAIVNLDEPVEVQGQTVPLGRQFASGLVSGGETADGAKAAQPAPDATNFDWTITDEETAADGLANGTYAAVVTIPKNFSAAATSMGNDDPSSAEQATIDVSTPPGGRVADDALARVVAATATSVMSSTLTETYVDNVLVGFNDLSDGIGQAQDGANQLQDGADQLADGADQASDGAGQLADGADQLADGASSAASGASGVASGASGIADGAGQLASGASQVAGGARGIAGGIGESAQGADDLAESGEKLAGGATQVAEGNRALADQVAAINDEVPDVTAITKSLADAQKRADEFAAAASAALGCDVNPSTDACAALADTLAQLQTNSAGVEETIQDVVDARGQLDALATQTDKLATGAEGVATGVEGIAGGNRDLAKGLRKLQGGASQVADGADGVASGAGTLSGGANQLATGASQLSTGVGQLATGATGVASGATDLSSGVGQLASGSTDLASGAGDLSEGLGDAKGQIPTTTDAERQTLSSVVAEPVKAPTANGISTGASGPLFAVVALWLGALALLTIFPPVLAGALGSTRDSVRLALRAFALPAAVGAVTGAAVGVILAAVESLDLAGWVGAIIVGAVASVAFVAVHQGFVGLLGNLGRGISLLIAVLLIATGIVATVPSLLQGLVDALPVGAARDALTAVVVPAAGGLGMGVTLLVLWGLGGLALATLVTARGRRLGVRRLLRA
ncbi:YhgE/Pip domain-containing protein [Isoptericola sp. NPDC057653]|uniref:YhgE/Pip domain-containing protein n=1 Tax=Isoptericola sp. NPDC057653 TaxID=3346195 RepID=UPI0036B3DF8D